MYEKPITLVRNMDERFIELWTQIWLEMAESLSDNFFVKCLLS